MACSSRLSQPAALQAGSLNSHLWQAHTDMPWQDQPTLAGSTHSGECLPQSLKTDMQPFSCERLSKLLHVTSICLCRDLLPAGPCKLCSPASLQ